MKKYIYFHICAIGSYATILNNMMTQIKQSGILYEIEEMRCFITGKNKDDIDKAKEILSGYNTERSVISVIKEEEGNNEYERFTLHCLLKDCKEWTEEDRAIMYIHSKGVSHSYNDQYYFRYWVRQMLFGLLDYRELCWKKLRTGVDTVGCFFIKNHFAGNFWWARSSHIAKLSTIGPDYYDPEMWLISHEGVNVVCITSAWLHWMHTDKSDFHFLSNICFDHALGDVPTETNIIPHSSILSIEMGLRDKYSPCVIPPPSSSFKLSNLECQDAWERVVKMVRFFLKDGSIKYFLERDIVNLT